MKQFELFGMPVRGPAPHGSTLGHAPAGGDSDADLVTGKKAAGSADGSELPAESIREDMVRSAGEMPTVPGAVADDAAAAGADWRQAAEAIGARVIGHGPGWAVWAVAGRIIITRVEEY